jgi:hypothetical protein
MIFCASIEILLLCLWTLWLLCFEVQSLAQGVGWLNDSQVQTSEESKTFKPLSPRSPRSRLIEEMKAAKFANVRTHSPARESRALLRPEDLQVAFGSAEPGGIS